MTITHNTPGDGADMIVRNDAGVIVGYINYGGCTHPACKYAMREGRYFHVTPRGFHIVKNHFATLAEATDALLHA